MDFNENREIPKKKDIPITTHRENSHKESSITQKVRGNPWILSTIVLGVLSALLIFGNLNLTSSTIISEEDAGELLVGYYEAQGIEGLEVILIEDFGEFYEIKADYQGQTIPFYVTKTGYLTGNSIISLIAEEEESSETEIQDIPKSDKPVVELFIMTHCPYGTQAEKGIIPAIETLGDSIDAKIRFVHYFMHEPEKNETPIQVCIREEQSGKYLSYLKCFLEDGDSDRCLTKAGIDKNKMNNCILNGKSDEYYEEDSILSEGYGVQGSPTLVVNGKQVSSGRSPAAYLDSICQAFTDGNVPEECGTQLSTTTYSAGFGYEGTGSNSNTQCG